MKPPQPTLAIRFTPLDEQSYRLRLDRADVGERPGYNTLVRDWNR
jgi:hypothetical protein